MRVSFRLFLLLTVAFCAMVVQWSHPSDSGRQKVSEDIQALIRNAGSVEQYPNAETITIFDRTEIEYKENGDYTSRGGQLIKILTESGKEKYATINISYHKRYEEVTIETARVIYPDGTFLDVPPESIKDGTSTGLQDMNIFEENFRNRTITVPDLAVGCCIQFDVKTVTRSLIKDNFAYVGYFQGIDPVLECTVAITGPARKPLRYVVKNGEIAFSKHEDNGLISYRWEARNIPQIIQEPGMVSAGDVALKLVVSTFPSWKELSRYGEILNEGKVDMDQQLKETVHKLTDHLKTDREKILAIHRFVSQKIRYMGSSMDVGAFIEPHKATYTFAQQYGVCRDKSVLMMAMLKEIGIDCYDVLLNVTTETVTEIPTIYFQHAIAGVVLKDGSVIYMDPTLELSSVFGETYVGDKHVLLLSRQGNDLIVAPHVPAEKSMGKVVAQTELQKDGTLSGSVKVEGSGYYDFVLRSYNQYYPAVQFERYLSRLGTRFHPNTELSDVRAPDPADLNSPYYFSFRFSSKDYSVPAGNYLLFRLPLASCTFDIAVAGVFDNYTKLKARQYPMEFFSTRGCRQSDVVTIPEGYRVVSLPQDLHIKEGPCELTTRTQVNGRTISYSLEYGIEKSRLSPAQYQDLRKVALQLKRNARSFVILEKMESK